jgi:glutamate carboxypeptidase
MAARAQVGIGRLDVTGREAHAGSDHGNGASAVREIAAKVPALEDLTDTSHGIYVTVGCLQGGRRRSVVPGHAQCILDVRTPNAATWQETEHALHAVADEVLDPACATHLRLHAHRPAVERTPATEPLIDLVHTAGDALGTPLEFQSSPAAGSSAFAGGLGLPTLDGMGPLGGALMTDHEYVEIDSLALRASVLALALHLLSNPSLSPSNPRVACGRSSHL